MNTEKVDSHGAPKGKGERGEALPAGWKRMALGHISRLVAGVGFPVEFQGNTELPIQFYKVSDISNSVALNDGLMIKAKNSIEVETAIKLRGEVLPVGTTVFAKVGEALRLNRRGYISVPGLVDNNVMGVIPSDSVSSRYAYYFLKTVDMNTLSQSTTMPSVRKSDISLIPIPLPPLPEQERIAARLDFLLGKLKGARKRLDAMPELIKRLRKSVLAEAVSGRLTEEWRKGQKNHAWRESEIGKAGRVQLGRQRSPKYHNGGNMRPYLRVQNVFEDCIDLNDVMEMDFPGEDVKKYELHKDDVLLNEGQSPEFLGRPAIYNNELPGACFTNTLIRFQAGANVSPRFALRVFQHYMHSGVFKGEGTITTNIAHLGAKRFSELPIPLPSLPEQREIVRRVDELFAYADALEARVAEARKLAERLEPSILAKAFRGELSEQVPEEAAEWEKKLAEIEATAGELAKQAGGGRTRKPKAGGAEPTASETPRKRGRPRKA